MSFVVVTPPLTFPASWAATWTCSNQSNNDQFHDNDIDMSNSVEIVGRRLFFRDNFRCLIPQSQGRQTTVHQHTCRQPPQCDCCQMIPSLAVIRVELHPKLSSRLCRVCTFSLFLPLLSEFPVCYFSFHLEGFHLVRRVSLHTRRLLWLSLRFLSLSVCRVTPVCRRPSHAVYLLQCLWTTFSFF